MVVPKQRLLGVVWISIFYCIGGAILIVVMFTNPEKIGLQIANVHGLHFLAGFPILIIACILAYTIALGLFNMTPWGYWLAIAYTTYLLVVPPIISRNNLSRFGNFIWPMVVIIYLVLIRKHYFNPPANRSS